MNAFSNSLGKGNQAGVILLHKPVPETAMRKIAFDLGCAETAFVAGNGPDYSLRWFSPKREMPLCGHATVAAAKVLMEKTGAGKILFRYEGGTIAAEIDGNNYISIVLPLDSYKRIKIEPVFNEFFKTVYPIIDGFEGAGTKKLVLVLSGDENIRKVGVDFAKMNSYRGTGDRGIGLIKKAKKYDIETRYFNPWAGVNEDSVTGSVHTVIAKYWYDLYKEKEIVSYQNSQRPGIIKMRIRNKSQLEIRGQARIILKGHFYV